MEQLTQKMKDGDTKVIEVPAPQLGDDMVLVRNYFSVISAGTEGATANSARKSLLAKAKERPEQVRQVFDVIRRSGFLAAYRAVTKKLEAYSPCGYSSAGVVVAVGSRVTGFAPGDKAACAGVGYANHAELAAVPVNLCVKLDPAADLADAAYNTVGSIAMQGVRQADLRLGECAVVIGLGLIGQLTAQLLHASGVRVAGVDVSPDAVRRASRWLDLALPRSDAGIEAELAAFTGGNGADAVIVTAATSSLDPVNFAGRIARRRANIVIVGAVPTGFDRKDYYKKELSLKMSCSYGPGRYDLDYEEKGIDYPVEFVRWTERRNMEAFQQLLLEKRIDVKALTTHTFPFERAAEAYDLIVRKTEPFTGILLAYDTEKPLRTGPVSTAAPGAIPPSPVAKIGLAFIGAGSYAQGSLLPNLPVNPETARLGVLTNSGTTSRRVAERFHFAFAAEREEDILDNPAVNTVFIATRHDSHASYVVKSLRAGKNVFVEKPLALNVGELQDIEAALAAAPGRTLTIGFNRRFAPLARRIKAVVGSGAMSMIYRVNAGAIPPGTWIQDPVLGGGRIIGEACHFIDFMSWMCGSLPVQVYASALPDPQGLNDTVTVNLEFANGSTGAVCYCATGSKALEKEYFEVHYAGISAVLHDFKSAVIYRKSPEKYASASQDKGQKAMLDALFAALTSGGEPPIPFSELRASTLASFAVLESLREHAPIRLIG